MKAAQVLIYGVSQPVLITARGGKEQISSQPTFPSVARSISGFPSISITSLYGVFERSWPSYLSIPGKSPIRLLHSEKVFISFFFFDSSLSLLRPWSRTHGPLISFPQCSEGEEGHQSQI